MNAEPDRIVAKYLIETPLALERAAEAMAGEQSTGTFIALPGETEELHRRHGARVESVVPMGNVGEPSLAGAGAAAGQSGFHRGEITLSFPLENVGTALPNLLATVAGNLFELRQLSGIRLEDLILPAEFSAAHPGPQFAIDGTRKLANVYGRPIIGTIIKPSVGLTPDQTAQLAGDLATAGLDFIKDDELMANSPHSPFEVRLHAVMNRLHEIAEQTGRLAMYAANVTDELDEMLGHVDAVAAAGGTCVMVSVNAVGITGLREVRKRSVLPIHAHRNGWGALTRHPMLGYSFLVWQQLWRLAGADHLHVNGLRNKFWEPDDSVLRSARAVLTPQNGGPGIMPVFSSAQSALQVSDTYAGLASADLMYVCGGGIMAHPDGVAAGVASIRQSWEAALNGIAPDEYAASRAELKHALALFRTD